MNLIYDYKHSVDDIVVMDITLMENDMKKRMKIGYLLDKQGIIIDTLEAFTDKNGTIYEHTVDFGFITKIITATHLKLAS